MRKIHAKGQALESHYRRFPVCDGPLVLQEKSREVPYGWVSFQPSFQRQIGPLILLTSFLQVKCPVLC